MAGIETRQGCARTILRRDGGLPLTNTIEPLNPAKLVRALSSIHQVLENNRNDPGCSFAIPEWRTLGRLCGLLEDSLAGGKNAFRIHSYYLICAVLDRCRPFRVVAQRKARYA